VILIEDIRWRASNWLGRCPGQSKNPLERRRSRVLWLGHDENQVKYVTQNGTFIDLQMNRLDRRSSWPSGEVPRSVVVSANYGECEKWLSILPVSSVFSAPNQN